MGLLLGFGCVIVVILGVAAWNHIRYEHKRQRFEPFTDSERRFRDRISEGYLTVCFWAALFGSIYLTQTAWVAARGPNPITAMPYIALLAAGIAVFSLAVTSLNFFISMKTAHQMRIGSSAQMISYMTHSGDQLAIRIENASSSAAAYDVKAFVFNEDATGYSDKKKRFLGSGVVLLEAPSFPPSRSCDIAIPGLTQDDVEKGVNMEIRIEWTAFHDQSFASSFDLKTPISFQKAS